MTRHPGTALVGIAVVWLAVAVAAPLVGSHGVTPGELLGGDPIARAIVWELRLPRLLLALIAGGTLAIAGAALQTLFGNPLAEPYTLGVASGAALGAALAFTLAPALASLPVAAGASFAGGLGAVAVVLALARGRRSGDGQRLLLAGIAVALTCQALILFTQYLADATETLRMVRWMMGGLGVVGYRELAGLAPFAAAATWLLLRWRTDLDLLLAGEEVAASRGLDVPRRRRAVVVATTVAVSALVAVTGPIGFVGLMVPHMARRFVGAAHGWLLPACFLGGGAFLALCDTAARIVLAPAELPVGVVTALLGGPFFLALLARSR